MLLPSVCRQTSQNTTAEIVDGCSTSDGRATSNGLLVERVGGNTTIGGTAKPYKKSTSESGHRKPTNTATTGKKLATSSRGGKSIDTTASAADDGGVMKKRPCLETVVSTTKASLTLDEMKWIVDATSSNSGSQSEDKTGSATYSQEEVLWEMAAYSYDVILCVDNCELCGRWVAVPHKVCCHGNDRQINNNVLMIKERHKNVKSANSGGICFV